MIGCTKGSGKVCAHVIVKCANCGGGHMANSSRCTSRHKAGVKANKEKKLKKHSEKWNEKAISEDGEFIGERDESLEREIESCEASPDPEMRMDLGTEYWAENKQRESSNQDEIPEGIDHTDKFYCWWYNKTVERGMNVLFLRLRPV